MPSTTISSPVALHSSEAERTVLGAILADPDVIFEVASKLRSEDFHDPVHRSIYQAVTQLMEQGIAIDFVTVSAQLQNDTSVQHAGGSAFLAALASTVPTASHISHYADIVREKSRRHQLAAIGAKIGAFAQENGKSADELIELAEAEFLSLTHRATSDEPVPIGAMRADRFEHYVRACEGDDLEQGIRTGFNSLDDILVSLLPGQLIVLAGRPGMGKSAMALDIARSAAVDQNKKVAVFSLEMSKEEIFDRLFSASLQVEAWKLSKGMLTEDQIAQMGTVLDQFADYPLYVDDDHNSDLVNLRSKARRQQLRHGLDLLIVDYLQLVEVTDRGANENQTQRITYISKSLKRLGRELRCPVLALSQLSRECDRRPDKRPQLSDLRDSGSIEQDGDRILMLYRESEYFDDCDDPDCTHVFIRKNRHGRKGDVQLTFDRQSMCFREWTDSP